MEPEVPVRGRAADVRGPLTIVGLAVAAVASSLLFGTGGLSEAGGGAAVQVAAGLAAAALVTLAAFGRLPVPHVDRVAVVGAGALALYALLAAISGRWSWSPGAARDEALTAACYVAAWLVGVLVATLPRARRRVALTVGSLAVLTCVVAVAERVVSTPVQLNARLFGPIGHANGLAVVAILGLVVAAALVMAGTRTGRVVGGAAAALTALTLLLTGSRSGAGLGLMAVLALLVLTAPGPRAALRVVAVALVGALVGLWAGTWSTFSASQSYAEAPAGGLGLLTAAVLVTAAGALLGGWLPGDVPDSGDLFRRLGGRWPAAAALHRRGRGPTPAVVAAAAGAALLLVVVVLAGLGGGDGPGGGRAVDETGSGRLTSLNANNRDHWWGTAWSGFREHPWTGTGAGTFRLLEQVTRDPAIPAENAHNVVLEALAGTGLLGGLLMATAGIALTVGAARGMAAVGDDDRLQASALFVGAAAVFVQSLVEVDWDIEAVGVLATAGLGTLAARPQAADGGRPGGPLGRLLATLLVAWCVGFGVAAVPPWLAERAAADAELRIVDDPRGALDQAEDARRFDRRSARALMILGEAREATGDTPGAKAAFEQAVRLEPRNYETWLRAGTQQHLNWGDARGALVTLGRALELSGGNPTAAAALRDAQNSPTLLEPPG